MDKTKILITGASGQLGRAMAELYPDARAVTSHELDINSKEQINKFDWSDIQIIINAAAYTDVDGAETPPGRITAWQTNAAGVANLASIAIKNELVLVHISTDYIFDGRENVHTETEPFSPLSSYGASKAAGDIIAMMVPKHYILRSSWIVGEGKNFVRAMLQLGKQGISPKVVDDQIGRPTFTNELARSLNHLLEKKADFGVYNMTNEGDPISWADLARQIFISASLDVNVTNTSTQEYFADKPESAKRPANSLFDLSKLEATGFTPRNWREDLDHYVKKEMEKQQ